MSNYIKKFVFPIVLCFCFAITGCDKDDIVEEIPTQTGILTIDNAELNVSNSTTNNTLIGYTTCNSISLDVNIKSGGKVYRLSIGLLKNGEIKEVKLWLREETTQYEYYFSPIYQPEKTITISDFQYDEETNSLNLSVNGDLIDGGSTIDENSLSFSADFIVKNMRVVDCNTTFAREIQYNALDFEFNSYRGSIGKSSLEEPIRRASYYSNNGYRLTIIFENNPWLLPVGSYGFDENSAINTLILEEYIGPIRGWHIWPTIPSEEWKTLNTQGEISIDLKEETADSDNITGHLDFEVFDDGELIFQVENMVFTTTSL